jgi:ferredoxin
MKTAIYYYTGTGNSLWTARLMAKEIGDTVLYNMSQMKNIPTVRSVDAVGLVFPVHMWGVPSLAIRFIEKLDKNPNAYYFAVAVNAGQVSRTLIQLQRLMRGYGITLSAGFDIALPSNYIPWGGPGPAERLEALYTAAREKITHSASLVKSRASGHIEKGPLWQRIIFTSLYKMTYNMVPKMDKDFWVDEKCNGCAICANVCPVENVSMQEDKPVWLHHCEQCLACIQWCPKQAIQFGKKTPAYERYHHPEVKVKDMVASRIR